MLQTCGQDIVLNGIKFQKEREAWITALFLMVLGNYEGKKYWVGVEEIDQTPDTYGVSLRDIGKGLSFDVYNIEIVEYEKHSRGTLAEHIHSKLSGKKYPHYFTLLCYVHGHADEAVNLESSFNKVTRQNYSVGEIFLLSSQIHQNYDHKLIKLHPNHFAIDFSVEEEIRKLPTQEDIITKTKRGSGKDFTPLGFKVINFPDCE